MEEKKEIREKILVLGDEDFTLGFELVGIKSDKIENLENYIQKSNNIGILIISKNDYDLLSIKLKNKLSTLLKPVVVILSKDDLKGNFLREKIIKTMGVDLMK